VRTDILITSLAIMIATTAACTPHTAARRAPSAEEAVVRAARADQNRAIASHDLDRIAQFWTEDVVITAGLGRVLRGRTSYREAFQLDSGMVYERTPDQIQVSAQWPLAFESGHWTGRRGVNGAPIISGRYSAQGSARRPLVDSLGGLRRPHLRGGGVPVADCDLVACGRTSSCNCHARCPR
jgi:ketosteroid isomerase-like protein